MHTGLNHGRPGFNNAAAGRSLASTHCLQSKRCCQGDHIMVLSPCACMHTGGTAGAGTGTNRACPVARRCSGGVSGSGLRLVLYVRAPRAYTHARTGHSLASNVGRQLPCICKLQAPVIFVSTPSVLLTVVFVDEKQL